eukprot:scaffold68128_cov20-Tisochrysis_lutea.AAC.1
MTILAYPDLLLEGGKCLSGQPTVLCFPAQKCPLCDGRLTASAQRGQNNITLLTTTGPKEAQLVGWGLLAAACAVCGLSCDFSLMVPSTCWPLFQLHIVKK